MIHREPVETPDGDRRRVTEAFPGGFIVSLLPIVEGLDRWKAASVGSLFIRYDPGRSFQLASSGSHHLAVFGCLVSADWTTVDQRQIVRKLLSALQRSEASLLEALEACCERFACVYSNGRNVRVPHDACGMRTVYYCEARPVAVASHARLLATHLGAGSSARAAAFIREAAPRSYNMSFLPGHATTYEGIRMLCPNTYFEFENPRVTRYYPADSLTRSSDDEVIDGVSAMMRTLANRFNDLSPLAISLTAGLDSRLTLASCRDFAQQAVYLTYLRQGEKVNLVDAAIASRLASQFGLYHETIPFKHEIDPADEEFDDFMRFRSIAVESVEGEHFLSLAFAYTRKWPSGRLHLRSNIGEIARAIFHLLPPSILPPEGTMLDRFAAVYQQRIASKPHQYIREEIGRYINETGMDNLPPGWDTLNLYLLEHLMAVWHGSLLLESDFSHDTVCLYNCRKLLRIFLSGSLESQLSKRLMLGVARSLNPTVLDQPINPPMSQLTPAEVLAFTGEVFAHKDRTRDSGLGPITLAEVDAVDRIHSEEPDARATGLAKIGIAPLPEGGMKMTDRISGTVHVEGILIDASAHAKRVLVAIKERPEDKPIPGCAWSERGGFWFRYLSTAEGRPTFSVDLALGVDGGVVWLQPWYNTMPIFVGRVSAGPRE